MKTTHGRIFPETGRAPAQIALDDAGYPANLREIATPPERLYVRGGFEERDWLRRGLDRLPPEQRLVVELTFFVGCSYEEISAIADCPVNTVKTRMFHARRKLRGILNALEGEGPRNRP